MIDEVMLCLKHRLNTHLSPLLAPFAPDGEPVAFPDTRDSVLHFPDNQITLLLVNLEEDTSLRAPDLHSTRDANGVTRRISPDLRINLYVLFVAYYADYTHALAAISHVIDHFQSHRILDRQNTPLLSERVERLHLEIVTLPFDAQNRLWRSLGQTYRPSVMYRVRLLVFRDQDSPGAGQIQETAAHISQLDDESSH